MNDNGKGKEKKARITLALDEKLLYKVRLAAKSERRTLTAVVSIALSRYIESNQGETR